MVDHRLNPYVGPRPFERGEEGIFFGRNREMNSVVSLVVAHPVVLVYGQSGTGKTSLIRTKVIAGLEEGKGFQVFYGRVSEPAPRMQIEAIPNIFVFNAIRSFTGSDAPPDDLANKSLADLLREHPRLADEDELPGLRVLILDQFEELFTSYPERWKEREGFFKQLSAALEEDRLLRVVFAMREDYIADLDPYASILPENLRTRFRIERLRQRGALEAVTKPLQAQQFQDTGCSFAPGVAENLVRGLLRSRVHGVAEEIEFEGEFVDLVQLQVVCQTLWQNLDPEIKIITQEHLATFGEVDEALKTFFEAAVRKVSTEAGISEGKIRNWFERLFITSAGTRATVFRGDTQTRGMPNKAVDQLEGMHLLSSENRAGARWYELSHDRLIQPIQASNRRWLETQSVTVQQQQRIEDMAAIWERAGRADNHLLDQAALLEAKRWLEGPEADELGYSPTLFELIRASQLRLEKQSVTHRLRRWLSSWF